MTGLGGEGDARGKAAFVVDLDRTLVTVMVPTAPRTTFSSSPPDPTHVPMTVTLRQIVDAVREVSRG